MTEATITTMALFCNSAQVGQEVLLTNSLWTSSKYAIIFFILSRIRFYIAREERLELPTPGFGDQCSTN